MNYRKFLIVLMMTSSCLLLATGSSAQRLPPDTTDKLLVWADQLDTSGPAQDQFVGENFVGSQKLTKNLIDPIRSHNPNFLVLQYHKAYGVDLVDNITDANTWSPDIEEMQAWIEEMEPYIGVTEEDLYLHYTDSYGQEQRVEHYWNNNLEYYLANLEEFAFHSYVAEETIRRAEVVGFDGTFFDVAHFPWYGYEPSNWFAYEPWKGLGWSPNEWENGDRWNNMATPYWQWIDYKYHSDNNNYLAIANVGRMIDGWYEYVFLDEIDGGMSESFMTDTYQSHNRLVGGDWVLSAERILRYLTSSNKVLIAQPNNSSSSDLEMREWWVANYFLLKGNKSYYYYEQGMQVAWWPEYDIDLGAYTTSPPAQLDSLLAPGTTSLYVRSYDRGLVLVNPGDTAQSYTLNNDYCQYAFSGGGTLSGTTKPAMSLQCTGNMSGTISIAPHDALILGKLGSTSGDSKGTPWLLLLLDM